MSLLVMRRSKLETHVDILRALARHGPLKVTHITYKANVNSSCVKQYLEFLVENNLVEKQTLHNRKRKTRIVYGITAKGRTVLKHFKELDNALQVTGESNEIPTLLY